MGVGRNSPCPCGSGRRHKDCCGRLAPARSRPDGLPGEVAAQLNAANALARAGKLPEAAACYAGLLTLRPDFAEGHANLGELQLEQGRPDLAAASCARAIAIQPDFAQAHQLMAKARFAQERFDEAAVHARHALRIDAGFAEAHNTLGNVLVKLARVEEALASFRCALALKPVFAEAHMNLGKALRSIGHLEMAAAAYRRVLEINPRFVPAHVELATVLRLQRRSTESEQSCRRALELDPNSTAPLAVLAEVRADAGQFAQAEELHRRIISMDGNALDSWAALARLRRMSAADREWLVSAERLLAVPMPARRELALRYAVGKYHDDIGDFDRAFAHYRRANALSAQCAPPHDRAALTRNVDLIIRSQDRSWMKRQPIGDASERPVFIVGMLRSGTTLAEQILASHPAVFGAGELSFFGTETAAVFANAAPVGGALDFSETEMRRLAAGYLDLLRQLSDGAPRVVDKFPANFFFLGLIRSLFPRARFIHMQRDPRDTCLSIYFQQFEAANTYANDLDDLAHYYGEYRRLMRHWADLADGALLHVPYEQLVAEPEAWSRRMVEFVGLPWNARCLEFQHTDRAVVTASRWQVRQAMSTSSVGRWRNYERHFGALAALPLGD
jgi:tetratricopeptide (TPR) repeat protein